MAAPVAPASSFPRGTATSGHGYATTFGRGVVALELATGRPAWTSSLAGTPWAAGSGLVAVAAPKVAEVIVAVLEAADGTLHREVSLPVPAELAQPAGDFDLEARLAGSSLEVAWRLPARYEGGAPPPAFARERETVARTGALRCDLGTGVVVRLPVEIDAPLPQSWPYRRRGAWRERAWRIGDLPMSLSFDDRALSLQRPGRAPRPLARAEGFEPVVTPCGRFLFVRPTKPPGPWELYSLPEAHRLGTLDWPPEAQLPAVAGGRAFCLLASRLVAADIATGKTLWSFDLGPIPAARPPQLPR